MRVRSLFQAGEGTPTGRRSRQAVAPGPKADSLPFDEAAFESRVAWIFGSPRTGSTWLLTMLIHPWRLTTNDTGIRPPTKLGATGPPDVVPINESHIPIHLTPLRVPRYDPDARPGPEEFLSNTKRARDAAYFFNETYADAWKPEVRRLILARFRAQAERACQKHGARDPLVVIKEPNGSHGAQLVMSLLPRAKLVFLIRDGRDVIDSQLALRLPGGAHAERRQPGDGKRRSDRDPVRGYEARVNYVLKHSRMWVNRMNAVQSAYEAHPPELRYLLRYEDLRHDTPRYLGSLMEWLGIPRTEQQVRAAAEAEAFEAIPEKKKGFGTGKRAAQPGLWRSNLTAVEQRVVEEVMGEKLTELGYQV